jgi:uncharacterized protein YggE
MNLQDRHHGFFALIFILGFLLVALAIFYAPKPEITLSTTSGTEKNMIRVEGSSTFEVDPDEAEVYVRVQTEEPTAKRAQEENARLMSSVKSALKRSGISESDMETTNYNLWPQQEWNPETQKYEKTTYMVQHLLKITTKDVTGVGDILDVAVKNGANGLDRIDFKLSDKRREDVNSEALAQASGNAREKAEAISQSLGVRLGKLSGVSESNVNYNYYPRAMYAMAESVVGAAKSFDTDISPQSVSVSASISLVYEIE